MPFLNNVLYNFLIAFGIVVGASIFAGIRAIINDHPPMKTMPDIAGSIKIWAVAVALGGTFSSFEIIERGILKGEIKSIIKQVVYILIALIGANAGSTFIGLLQKSGETWLK